MLRLSEMRLFLQSSSFWEARRALIGQLWPFMRHFASRRVNITMSVFVIGEMTNNNHYSTQLKTHVCIISGKFFE